MKKSLTLFSFISSLLALTLLPLPSQAAAQKRKHATNVKPKVTATTSSALEAAQKAIDTYDVERARSIIDKEMAALRRKKQPTAQWEAMLQTVDQIAVKLHATERIIIIDSLVCPKEQALKAIRLSQECGRIDTYASTYHTSGTSEATIYENDLGNRRYLAIPAASSSSAQLQPLPLRLAVSDKLGNQWSTPTPLIGLADDTSQNFPFLLSDGVTLYYAAKGSESMGGYDIFVTRADGEDGSFLTPENIGFPFNSTANDYLMAIDEQSQLGWFVTDRRQPSGKVCVYTFIPNDTRQLYGDEIDDERLRSMARITSIRSTWPSAKDARVQAAIARLASLRAGTNSASKTEHEFTFVIDDQHTYTRLGDFRSSEAREKMKQYVALDKATHTDATMLQRLRDNYAKADASRRQQLATSILRLEATYYPNLEQLRRLAKEIRNTEITHK